MDKEIWVPIIGHENFYEISNLGRVKSLKRVIGRENFGSYTREERFLKLVIKKSGYCVFSVMSNGLKEQIFLHRIIAEYFIPNPDDKAEVNHINGIKTDNRIENLEWATRQENAQHAFRTGLMNPQSGVTHYSSKRVINLKTGETFNTARDAAKSAGISTTHFYGMMSGERRNSTCFVLAKNADFFLVI
jgi:hypothetical protein